MDEVPDIVVVDLRGLKRLNVPEGLSNVYSTNIVS